MSDEHYTIRLVARNEGVEYVNDVDVYRFRVEHVGQVWKLYLPCTKGADYEIHELTEEEKTYILPRIVKYLETIWYFGFFHVDIPWSSNGKVRKCLLSTPR